MENKTAVFDCIKDGSFIDPPYNTGNDFVYEDDFKDPIEHYKQVTSMATRSNPETMGRFHTAWLNMMYPRLRLAATLLRDDGVCFISIDDNEVRNLRMMCDEVFGEENFVAQLIWERAFAPKNDAKYISNSHDYVLMYAKSLNNFDIGKLPRTEEANNRYKNPDNDQRGDWVSGDLTVKTYNANTDYEITTPSGRRVNPPNGVCWRVSKEKFDELVADNRIWFGETGENVPRLKRFLSEIQEGMTPTSILFHKVVGHSQEGRQELRALFDGAGYFDGPKPVRMLNHLLALANTNKDSVILDFFSGSATTAHAVMQLNAEDSGNRQFIMVQLPELTDEKSESYKAGYKNICDIGMERIRRAGAKVYAEWEEKQQQLSINENAESPTLDIGFKVFELDTSNLKTWDGTPVTEENARLILERMDTMYERVKPDRTDLDMVYEIMLKMGFTLDMEIQSIQIQGKTTYVVDDYLLLIYLDESITPEIVEELCDLAPAKLLVAKDSFENATAMANAHYICQDKEIEFKLV